MAVRLVKVLVTGGYYDDGGDGVIWCVDFTTQRAEVVLRWRPPPHLLVPSKGFAGGSLGPDGLLYVAAHAAVVRVDPLRAVVTGVLHQPCMNDLHHVAAQRDRLYVSNTGLSAVDVFTLDGTFLGSHALLPGWASARRLEGSDLPADWTQRSLGWQGEIPAAWPEGTSDDRYFSGDRRHKPFHRLKVPDYLHVNHVAMVRGRMLATCFADGTLRDVERFEVVARFEGAYLHDGVSHGDGLWLTAIDGTLLEVDADSMRVRSSFSVFETGHYGWCRGVAVTDDYLLVGLTEVRRGTLPRHHWANRDPDGSETSVLLIDRRERRLVGRVTLSDEHRHSKLYSVIPMPEAAR